MFYNIILHYEIFPMNKIRVLVVDDAVVIRKMVSDVIASDPLLELAGTAANGKIALAKIPQINPDLVTLDVEMPEMNGLDTVSAIRKIYPKLPIIMFSTLTQRGAETTIEALARGANDYVTKPANVGSVTEAIQSLREQLLPKIKLFCQGVVSPTPSVVKPQIQLNQPSVAKVTPSIPSKVQIVAIGVSTGGPNALAVVLPQIPKDFSVPIVIVQHMPPLFTKLLAERLSSQSQIQVVEANQGDIVRPGMAYIAPGNYHMVLYRSGTNVIIGLNQGPPENSCRPAVDVTFRSVVDLYGSGTLGIILTGMGQDGLRGCEKIRAAHGQIITQDEQTSVVWGMPGFVTRAGLADKVLPLSDIASEIIRRSGLNRSRSH